MKIALTLSLACGLSVALAPLALAQQEEAVFSPRMPQDVAISQSLLGAEHSIYMALYSISADSDWVDNPGPDGTPAQQERYEAFQARLASGNVKVFDMLKLKTQEGLKCRLVLHRAAIDSWAIDRARSYESIGVEVRWTHKTMHHKFAILDKRTLINGSGNWSRGAAERYSENTIFYSNHRFLVRKFLHEFYYLWYGLVSEGRAEEFEDDGNLPADEPETAFFVPREVKRYGDDVEAYFTSENKGWSQPVCANQLIEMMRGAERQILIMINHFNMGRISEALIKVHRQRNQNEDPSDDIEIKVLLDLGEYDADISRAREMERVGIECRYKFYGLGFWYPRAQFMHHKVLVADSKRMITGSYNWSSTAEYKNYENITVHKGASQQDVIDAMEGEFWYLWDLRRDLYPAFREAALSKPGDLNYRRYVPVHFYPDRSYYHTPMSLSRAEIDQIRDSLESLGFQPPNAEEEDEEAKHRNGLFYFDKETGKHTDNTPPGRFIDGEEAAQPGAIHPENAPEVKADAQAELEAAGLNNALNEVSGASKE